MYRIRLHGRGGQGMKTAGRILGSALFAEGYEVQDAPRYGAERRGAPVFSYVRADKQPIRERGVILRPDLVVVADDTLVPIPAAGVLAGIEPSTVLLLNTEVDLEEWKHRLNLKCTLLKLPTASEDEPQQAYVGARCAGAAARLLGVVSKENLERALAEELSGLSPARLQQNLEHAVAAFDALTPLAGTVQPAPPTRMADTPAPDWVSLPREGADISAPAIHASANSVQVRTGLWRTMRPVIDPARCKHCWWICSTYCPDSAIPVEQGVPRIDYDHCKGCMICVTQCPSHAIEAVPESAAASESTASKNAGTQATEGPHHA